MNIVNKKIFPGYFNLKFEMMSDGWTYWTDSTEVIVTGIEEEALQPLSFNLEQNYPNPFNPSTNIRFRIPASTAGGSDFGFVSLKVFDILGNEVATLVNEEKKPGNYKVEFDGSNLSSGVYFYQLTASSFIQTKKMILLH